MTRQRLTAQRLVAWFVAGWLLLGWPLLALWDHPVQVAGLPLLPLALFAVWAGLIAAVGWVIERDAPARAAVPADRRADTRGPSGTPGA